MKWCQLDYRLKLRTRFTVSFDCDNWYASCFTDIVSVHFLPTSPSHGSCNFPKWKYIKLPGYGPNIWFRVVVIVREFD